MVWWHSPVIIYTSAHRWHFGGAYFWRIYPFNCSQAGTTCVELFRICSLLFLLQFWASKGDEQEGRLRNHIDNQFIYTFFFKYHELGCWSWWPNHFTQENDPMDYTRLLLNNVDFPLLWHVTFLVWVVFILANVIECGNLLRHCPRQRRRQGRRFPGQVTPTAPVSSHQ